MYQYFPSKESLVVAIYQREAEEQHAAFVAMAEEVGTEDVPRLIRAFAEWTIARTESMRDLNRVFMEELPTAGLDYQRSIDHIAAERSLFAIAGPRVQPSNRDVAALVVVRVFRYLLISYFVDPPPAGAGGLRRGTDRSLIRIPARAAGVAHVARVLIESELRTGRRAPADGRYGMSIHHSERPRSARPLLSS